MGFQSVNCARSRGLSASSFLARSSSPSSRALPTSITSSSGPTSTGTSTRIPRRAP